MASDRWRIEDSCTQRPPGEEVANMFSLKASLAPSVQWLDELTADKHAFMNVFM